MKTTRIQMLSAAFALSFCSLSVAGTLVDFKPLPVSPSTPEFAFSRALGGGVPVFRGDIGATSNNDGTLPIVNQTPGGLLSETPFIIPGVPGSQFGAASTLFFDCTLQFTTGLAANAPALSAGGTFIQQLSPGSFQLLSTGPTPALLLSGNINTATFIVGTGNAGAVFNASGINYTGGLIYNALVASGSAVSNNSMSISMTDVAPNFAIAGDGYLGDFNANATGLFNATVVPEPTSIALFALAIGGLIVGRSR